MGKRLYDSLKDVPYQGALHQIRNNLYPFLLDEVKGWPCGNSDIAAQLLVANEDWFLAKWLAGRTLSSEAQAVMGAAKSLYRSMPRSRTRTGWMRRSRRGMSATARSARRSRKSVSRPMNLPCSSKRTTPCGRSSSRKCTNTASLILMWRCLSDDP